MTLVLVLAAVMVIVLTGSLQILVPLLTGQVGTMRNESASSTECFSLDTGQAELINVSDSFTVSK